MAVKKLDIELDINELTLGELEILSSTDEADTVTTKVDILASICTKGNIRDVKLKDLPRLISEVEEAVESQSNPTSEP